MAMVCYNKPNRSKIRHFTTKDVIRISKYAVRDGAEPIKIIAAIVAVMGLGAMICRAAKAISAFKLVIDFLAGAGGALALSKLLERLIALLSRGLVLKIPGVSAIVIAVLVILAGLNGILNAITTLANDASVLVELSKWLNDLCFYIDQIGQE